MDSIQLLAKCKTSLPKMFASKMLSLLLVLATVGVTMTAGTLCGFWLSSLLYQNGAFYMAFRFPTAFALTYAGVLIGVPLLIVFVSLRGFSKEALVERLRGAEA